MNEQNWVPFYFDSNMYSGMIEGLQDWGKLRSAYPLKTTRGLLMAKEATYGGVRTQEERERHPKYGFRIECDGEPLRDFFERHNMYVEGM